MSPNAPLKSDLCTIHLGLNVLVFCCGYNKNIRSVSSSEVVVGAQVGMAGYAPVSGSVRAYYFLCVITFTAMNTKARGLSDRATQREG